jgi:plasmid stability protein
MPGFCLESCLASSAIIAYDDIIDCIYETDMASVTIRDLPDEVKQRLRVRAAQHRRSLEAEVRQLLIDSVVQTSVPQSANRLTWAAGRFMPHVIQEKSPVQAETRRAFLYGDDDH